MANRSHPRDGWAGEIPVKLVFLMGASTLALKRRNSPLDSATDRFRPTSAAINASLRWPPDSARSVKTCFTSLACLFMTAFSIALLILAFVRNVGTE